MPRDSNGTYTLPAGNPVVSGTTISSTWANSTLSDIATALTDSLSRDGEGSMAAPLQLADGSIGAPGLTWANETTTGWYRAGSGDIRFAISGGDKTQITTNGFAVTPGTAALPSYTFIGDTDTGMYRSGANEISFSTNGTVKVTIASAGGVLGSSGSAANPSFGFIADPNTGVFSSAADTLGLTAGGIEVFNIASTGSSIWTGTTPSIRFVDSDGAVDEKIWTLSMSTAGSIRLLTRTDANGVGSDVFVVTRTGTTVSTFTITSAITSFSAILRAGDGSTTTPAYGFTSDTDMGFYRSASNTIGVSCGNAETYLLAANVFRMNGSAPGHYFFEDDVAADTGLWRTIVSGGSYFIQSRTDANGTGENLLSATRSSGTAVSTVTGGGTAWRFPSGSVSAPAIGFSGDVDNGLYLSGTNEVSVTTAGSLTASFMADGTFQVGFTGTGTSPVSYSFSSDPDTGITRGATNRVDIIAGGASNVRVGITSVLFSSAVTTVQFDGITTTASAANAFLDSGASNRLFRSTSSAKYKQAIQDLHILEAVETINALRPVTYESKIETDRRQRWYGLIAEEVAKVEPRLVHYAGEEPDGVQYDRIIVPLLAYVQHLEERISRLEN